MPVGDEDARGTPAAERLGRPGDALVPPRARPTGGWLAPTGLLRLGAAVAVAMMAGSSTGDALAAGVLLGLAAGDVVAGVTGVLAGIAVLGRWGSTSLAALAGGQAVMGPAGWTGPPGLVLSSWAAAAAVVVVCPRGAEPALAGGVLAAALVAGPATGRGTTSVVALRLAASVVAVAAALMLSRAIPRPAARLAGVVAALAAASLALLP